MIPGQFQYVAAKNLDEAVALLSKNAGAKILAGGHSLIPAMKLRLAMPEMLIDLGRIRDLSYIREQGDQIRIGAMTTHFQLESSDSLRKSCPLLPETAAHIGDVQVRNKGTIGGSLAHSDPAGDWPAVILALDADLVAVSTRGERVIAARDFFVDMLTTALQEGEILREIRVRAPQGRFGQAYLKMAQPASGFAVVGVAVSLTADNSGVCQSAAVAITGVASKAFRAKAVEAALVGKKLNAETAAAAAKNAANGVDANGDLYASAEFRKHLTSVFTRRAVELAASRISS